MRICWLLGCWLVCVGSTWAEQTIVYEKDPDVYETALLELALSKTVDEGPYHLRSSGLVLSEKRAELSLNEGKFDVTFMVLTPEREQQLLPIRIDLTRGIQGYRLLLIHRDEAARFAAVQSLEELKSQFTAGFGAQWGDLGVLEANDLKVETASDSSKLYRMLQARRFDYFPRGVNEVWDNLEQHQDEAPDMIVEPHLALAYPLVQCFVVAKTNVALAARIQRGLERALADGSMKKLFLQFHGPDIARARLSDRRIFTLSNPELPRGGPEVDTSWWLPAR